MGQRAGGSLSRLPSTLRRVFSARRRCMVGDLLVGVDVALSQWLLRSLRRGSRGSIVVCGVLRLRLGRLAVFVVPSRFIRWCMSFRFVVCRIRCS